MPQLEHVGDALDEHARLVLEGQVDTVVAEVREERERIAEPVVGETVEAVAEAEAHVADTRLIAAAPTGADAARPRAAAWWPVAARAAPWSGTRPRMPAPVARRTVPASGVRAAASWARRTPTAYAPVRATETAAPSAPPARPRPDAGTCRSAEAVATTAVAATQARARPVEPPWTSPRLRAVTPAVWTATRVAGTAAARRPGRPPALAPRSTSSPRVEAIVATLTGPCFGERS